jgi:hypothetical protein
MYEPEQPYSSRSYYADSVINVAADGIWLRDKRRYTWDAVRSVEMRRYRSSRMWRRNALFFVPISYAAALFGFIVGAGWADEVRGAFCAGIALLVALLAFVILYPRLSFPMRHFYVLRVHGTFGAASILATAELPYVETVSEAIKRGLGDKLEAQPIIKFVPPPQTEPPLHTTPQHELFQAEGVYISDKVVQFGHLVLNVGDIESLNREEITVEPAADIAEIVVFSLLPLYYWLGPFLPILRQAALPILSVLAFLGLLLWLFERSRKRTHAYLIRLEGTFGKVVAFATLEKEYADYLIHVIYSAMHERRQLKLKAQEAG